MCGPDLQIGRFEIDDEIRARVERHFKARGSSALKHRRRDAKLTDEEVWSVLCERVRAYASTGDTNTDDTNPDDSGADDLN
ncbi:MAG: hypothetical protein ACPG4N_06085 [Gammaproteobacteria bacterium]